MNISRAKLIPGGQGVFVFTTEKTLCVPFDPSNTDYQAYLAWLEKGNTPLPADSILAEDK